MEKTTALIVEDEPMIGLDSKKIIQELGYQVVFAVNSSEATVYKAEKDKPDVVLMVFNFLASME